MAEHFPELSIVIPVFNEAENLTPLYSSLKCVLDGLEIHYEIFFVDDGSTDGSTQKLKELAENDSNVHLLQLTRNFGQTAAMSAGFEHASGSMIVPLDADLQNDPRDIPRIIEKLRDGYDVVSCWRKNRKDPWLTRTLPSRVANHLISWISGVHLHDYGCTLKGYRKETLEHIQLYGEMHRFIPIFASWAGARVVEISVQHHPRQHGKSKYGILRTGKVILDLITIKFLESFSTKPMYLFGGLGFVSVFSGTLLTTLTLYQKLWLAVKVHRNPLMLFAIFFFLIGIQFVLFGLVAELMARTYHESQSKPTYILKNSIPSKVPNQKAKESQVQDQTI